MKKKKELLARADYRLFSCFLSYQKAQNKEQITMTQLEYLKDYAKGLLMKN
jgi:hypothetical protein